MCIWLQNWNVIVFYEGVLSWLSCINDLININLSCNSNSDNLMYTQWDESHPMVSFSLNI